MTETNNCIIVLHIPPHFVFSTYDQFNLWPVVQNESSS